MRVVFALALLAGCDSVIHGAARQAPDAGTTGGSRDGGGGTSGDATSSDAGASITPSSFLDGWETKYCAAAFACKNNFPTNTGLTFSEAFGQSTADCHAILQSYDMPATVEMQVTNGGILWNPTAAQTCLSSFAYQCSSFWSNGPTWSGTSCQNALVGTVQDGGSCLTTWQCQSWTSYCDPNTHRCTP